MVFWILVWVSAVLVVLMTIASVGVAIEDEESKFVGALKGFFMGAAFCVVMSLLIIMLLHSASRAVNGVNKVEVDRKVTHLRALSLDSQVKGSIFLASGSVGEEDYIRFIKLNKDGSNSISKISADYAKVWEVDTDEPRLESIKYAESIPWLYPWTVDSFNRYEFYVPEGSIVESSTIDLNG